MIINKLSLLLALLITFTLSACGGGGGGSVVATGINDNSPIITSATAISTVENTSATGYTATADDADGDTVTFSLTGGLDQSALSIDNTSGVLNFNAPADFELPADSDGNNTYEVTVAATDGTNFVTQNVIITVTNVNDNPPIITSATAISTVENTSATGYTATADDADGDTVMFSLTNGLDQAVLSIDNNSGVLNFNAPPDFELPADSDGNNTYEVTVTASDGTNSVTQNVTVSVTNINDAPPAFTSNYTVYSSTSLDGVIDQPDDKSKLCLYCHDGTQALDSINTLFNQVNTSNLSMTSTNPDGTISDGPYGANTGFTSRIGIDLSNDHPISVTFDSSRAASDGELHDPAVVQHLGEHVADGPPPLPQGNYLPLETNKVECISCHESHVQSNVGNEDNKFLRANRFQQQPPVDNNQFDDQVDIICLGCHDKAGWTDSAHANHLVADEQYTTVAARLREFPDNLYVWKAACLNCHDLHTVSGSRHLLREGVDDGAGNANLQIDPISGAQYSQGGVPAIEQVCYACHSDPGLPDTVQTLVTQGALFQVPDIKTDFTTKNSYMPIVTNDQGSGGGNTTEVHSIRDVDLTEAQINLANRHTECTDCHNPHRVTKNPYFNEDASLPRVGFAGTHDHEGMLTGGIHSNIASGVLRGISGVEPIYSTTEFGTVGNPISFEAKRGDPVNSASPIVPVTETYLTREYQLCFKCHSNYAYGNTPPALGAYSGSTTPGTNSMTTYTNQAMEYQSPDTHKAEGTPSDGSPTGTYEGTVPCNYNMPDSSGPVAMNGTIDPNGNCSDFVNDNHRSWHPVVTDTGRTAAVRKADANVWRAPFNAGVGTQTMYCTDCHGSETESDTVVPGIPTNVSQDGAVWGPHGSNNNFLLKGPWSDQSGEPDPNTLCFRCHDPDQYARNVVSAGASPVPTGTNLQSGFKLGLGGGAGCLVLKLVNLHLGHATTISNFRCTFCHVAVPHGWKNKSFLANLNDVGPESSTFTTKGNQVRYTGFAPSGVDRYYDGPYYNGSVLKVKNFARSGEWYENSCGSAGAPGNGMTGQAWMAVSSEACSNAP